MGVRIARRWRVVDRLVGPARAATSKPNLIPAPRRLAESAVVTQGHIELFTQGHILAESSPSSPCAIPRRSPSVGAK